MFKDRRGSLFQLSFAFARVMVNMMLAIGTKVRSHQCAIVLVYIIKEWEAVWRDSFVVIIHITFGICQSEQNLMIPLICI